MCDVTNSFVLISEHHFQHTHAEMFLLNARVRDLCFFPDRYQATAMHKVRHVIPIMLNREAIILLLKVGENYTYGTHKYD